jgi:hypothetical protein
MSASELLLLRDLARKSKGSELTWWNETVSLDLASRFKNEHSCFKDKNFAFPAP